MQWADVVELVDTIDSKSILSNRVPVRVRPSASCFRVLAGLYLGKGSSSALYHVSMVSPPRSIPGETKKALPKTA